MLVKKHFAAEIDRHCEFLTLNNEQWSKNLVDSSSLSCFIVHFQRTYMRQLFPHERADSLLSYIERTALVFQVLLLSFLQCNVQSVGNAPLRSAQLRRS